jgi:5-formyltetrahydrofolate cyclo-ligase
MKWKTKEEIRGFIWEKLTKDEIAQFPLPCWGRIPNFEGAEAASNMLLKLPEFKKSAFIFSAPDYVLHYIRELILQNRKDLLVATPHIQEFLLLKNIPSRVIKKAVTIKGMYQFGEEITLNQISRPLDIFCQGSVAIDQQGNRLGKGMGYGDREYHLLRQEGIVDKKTIIVTFVHDCQIFDNFSELMENTDVKVQIAFTPTRTIRF